MSELKRYVNKVSWTESVSQHKEAIIFMHDRQIKSLERQLAKREDDYREIRERSDKQIENLERQLAEARNVIEVTKKAIKLNFVDVKRIECCTDTALWVLDKLKEKDE